MAKNWFSVANSVLISAVFLASCSGAPGGCIECGIADARFYSSTWLVANPASINVESGADATAKVSAGSDHDTQSRDTGLRDLAGVRIVPPIAGVTLQSTAEQCDIPSNAVIATPVCQTYRLVVSAAAIAAGTRSVMLSAVWVIRSQSSNPFDPGPPQTGREIERLQQVSIALPAAPPTPDFQVAVGASTGGLYGTRATLPVSITRTGGFAEEVTLRFDGLTSGVRGSFPAEPIPTDRRTLELQIPARYASGGRVDLQVTATATSGLTKVVNFSPYIEPLFKLIHDPQGATLMSSEPLRVDVGLKAGDLFRSPSIGVVELSISPTSPLPEGVTARFLDDAMPVVPVLPVETVSRILQLVTDGRPNGMQVLQIRGTARGVPPDFNGEAPFIEVTLNLSVLAGQSWQFVGNNLSYGTPDAEAIGLAMQSDQRPVVAWRQRNGDGVYLRRFDGTTFAPSPPRSNGPSNPGPGLNAPSGFGRLEEAAFALTATDAGEVAFTYDGGTRLALGRAERAGIAWSIAVPIVVGDPADPATPRARSPRVATSTGDPIVVSYIREANAATTTGGVLQVLRSSSSGILSPLPTSLPGGSLNASPVGSVVRHATALALRADGNPWVAWIEQPTDITLPARLWLRTYDGNDWGPAIAVTTSTPLGTSVQLLVEPSGTVVVAWIEGSPAQLKLARYDPSSQSWAPLDNTGNGRGSLNVTALYPALDVHLAREPGAQGRLLVTWTEGGADPRVWIKRQNANGSWAQVGTTVSQVDRWAKTPRIVSDMNNLLYVVWATYAAGQNPGTALPYAEIDVAQWIFP